MGDLYNPFPKLPKNIRQIGDADQVVRLYVEDYVNTYLKRLYPTGNRRLRVGLLLGSIEQNDGTPYIFIDGALEMEEVETDGDKIVFTDSAWKRAYLDMEKYFPKRSIQGWFLCGNQGSQLSPLNYWKQHGQYFAGKNQIMYLNHGLEGEESIYITSENGFYMLKGHCIYYERNQLMQDYMITRKDARRVESGSQEQVIRDFRERMTVKKEQADRQRHAAGTLGMVCGVLAVAVLAGGVALVNNYNKMQEMESVLTSVLPAGVGNWEEYARQKAEEPDFIIEEVPGSIFPTESGGLPGETAESYGAEAEQGTEAGMETEAEPGAETEPYTEADNTAGTEDMPGLSPEDLITDADSDEVVEAIPYGEGDEGGGDNAGVGNNAGGENAAGAGNNASGGDNGDAGNGEGDGTTGNSESTESGTQSETAVLPPIDYEAAAAAGYQIYVVSEGETLYGICWGVYGDLNRLSEICDLNRLEDEDKILAGQKLILP